MSWTPEQIRKHTANLPEEPGVYIMRGHEGQVLYVGKAIHLRNRVGSYFHKSGDLRPFVGLLHGVLDRIETVVTRNEKEALILENELIKKLKPLFNIFLRDDKNYLYLCIDTREDFPRLDLVRRRRKDGATYFGPHHSASSVRGTHALVNRYFGLRTCRDHQFRNRSRPCLEYQVGRCLGPCCGLAGPDEYAGRVKDALLFLKGKHDDVLHVLTDRMKAAAESENFEEAARIRDQLHAVRASLTRQAVVLPTTHDADAVGFARDGDNAAVAVLRFEGGVLLDRIPYVLEKAPAPEKDLVGSFLLQYYSRAPVPSRLLLPRGLVTGTAALEEVLGIRGGRRVKVKEPVRGPSGDAVKMAGQNARALLRESLASGKIIARALARVAELLELDVPPARIEAFDMSTLQTTEPVGSMVVFTDGQPDRKSYRTYAVRGEAGPGDTGFMREVLARRFRKAREECHIPDLVLLDGGRSQLHAVSDVLEDLGWFDLPLAALAKARVVGKGSGPPIHSPERIFIKTKESPGLREDREFGYRKIIPPVNDPGLHLLMRLRDEAHRFAIRFHRKRRGRRGTQSALDGIPGLGKKRRTALLRHFGSVKAIRVATLDELEAVKGIPANVAAAVIKKLH